jgi:hypothetical protein
VHKAISRMAAATATLAGRGAAAAIDGLVGGTQAPPLGFATAGAKAVSLSRAGRAWRGPRASSVEFTAPPKAYATGGVPAVSPDISRVAVDISATTDGWLGRSATLRIAQASLGVVVLSDARVSRDQLAFLAP